MIKKIEIAAFGGFRTIPPAQGSAGADKFAVELYPRIVARGHNLTAFTRIYPGQTNESDWYEGVRLIPLKTVEKAGFDTLVHSFKCTLRLIFNRKIKCVHLHSGANSLWAILLRLSGKKVVVTLFAMDWKRDKWSWYAKLFFRFSNYLTAIAPNHVVFDNIFTKEYFEKKYNKTFDFIPYGSEVPDPPKNTDILKKIGVESGNYFFFVGRFIPDKGLHLLIDAFEKIKTTKKLVLVGGSPNPDSYEGKIKSTKDSRIIFPGYVYGDDTNILIKHAYAYIQPSLIEGLSPVILTVMGLGTPLICSDIKENTFITKDNASTFRSGEPCDLKTVIEESLNSSENIKNKAILGQVDVRNRFNWNEIADEYIEIFKR